MNQSERSVDKERYKARDAARLPVVIIIATETDLKSPRTFVLEPSPGILASAVRPTLMDLSAQGLMGVVIMYVFRRKIMPNAPPTWFCLVILSVLCFSLN